MSCQVVPVVAILSPTDGQKFIYNQTIVNDIVVAVIDGVDGVLTDYGITWLLDGKEIGYGENLSFDASFFNVAYNTITAVATKSAGLTGQDQVAILIRPLPCP